MHNGLSFIFATISGICFIGGLAVLRGGFNYGRNR